MEDTAGTSLSATSAARTRKYRDQMSEEHKARQKKTDRDSKKTKRANEKMRKRRKGR